MTNVKLKLMFFILNAVLSSNIIHGRPYSERNVTDASILSVDNRSFTLPVDPNLDTLVVASDEEIPEDTRSFKTQLDDIMNAEQDRDEALSEKVMKDQVSILEMHKDDAEGIEKQLNISSSLLDKIIDSETDREETLTDILFRHDSDFVEDAPRFEFLISRKLNESDASNVTLSKDSGFSENKVETGDKNISDVMKKAEYVELVEVFKPTNENKSAYNLANMTGHEVDNDLAPDTSFTDMQTLLLACFGTLLPLLAVLFATLAVRSLCRRWCPGWCKKPVESSVSESSEKHDTNQQLKSSEDGVSVGGRLEGLEEEESPPGNGSIFTMTLKNNHLIVETEERNDITKNGRETKMKYSPDNDGIFVVEVQQSAVYRPCKSIQNSPPHDPQISTNQALIHRIPEELERRIIEEDSERSSEKFDRQALALSSTGLSISDLSMSSIGSHNVSYSYGSQMGYEQGPFGYPVYTGYDISKDDTDGITHDNSQEPLIGKTPTDPYKPVVTAAIFKQDSIIGSDALQGPGYCIEGSTDGPLLSDVQAREYSLQHIHDLKERKMENGVAVQMFEKSKSPERKDKSDFAPLNLDNKPSSEVMEKKTEDLPLKDVCKSKKGSLPTIRTDVYESVKEVMLTGSPKFEKLQNEVSPEGFGYDIPPPMITITEESESGKSDSTS
ncbi:PREDICTED: uncharacterized protein LOC106108816 isoform X2 [Papilio polytes]|uniref:uncharacterized protein LOC106108816 isoform X2 n=1 Tax=Papilio polytes TaxID=76194 RepID=UPI0006769928|nr:PREDICTED: uncharacterized protein LOC106108816 isoform X2 [Papilio polytes]